MRVKTPKLTHYSRIPRIWGIEVWDNERLTVHTVPSGPVLQNIPVLWEILNLIVQDWKSAAAVGDSLKKLGSKQERLSLFGQLLRQLKPRIFSCFFSYITFFFMLENGYRYVYSELNHLNRELRLTLAHDKPPKHNRFLGDLWKVRNDSIAHWAGTQRKALAHSIAVDNWGFGFALKTEHKWDIEYCIPTHSKYPMQSIPEMHEICVKYLAEFDRVCCEYIRAIKMKLPITIGSTQYGR